jgi:ribosomal protein L12E/L44/L45/RPP1/RPP2
MKPWFIRIFASAILANSLLAFADSSPCKDKKMAACPAPAASAPLASDDDHRHKRMKKEKKMKKKNDQQKQDDNYPGYGVFG